MVNYVPKRERRRVQLHEKRGWTQPERAVAKRCPVRGMPVSRAEAAGWPARFGAMLTVRWIDRAFSFASRE